MSIFSDPAILRQEVQRLGATSAGRQFCSRDKLAEPPAPDPYIAEPEQDDTRLSHAELDRAERELAGEYGRAQVNDMVALAHAESGLGRSENERWAVLGQVVRALRSHERQVPADKVAGLRATVLKLAAEQGTPIAGGGGLEEELVRLTADSPEMFLTVSAEKRKALAKQGLALPDGSFPVHDPHHVNLAKDALKAGKLAGHSRAEVKAHINRAAKRHRMNPVDDHDEDDVAATVALSAGPQELARHAAAHGDSVDDIMDRYGAYFGR